METSRSADQGVLVPCTLRLFPNGSARLSCSIADLLRVFGYEGVQVQLDEAVGAESGPVEPGPGGE
jgi:hypothetical protein